MLHGTKVSYRRIQISFPARLLRNMLEPLIWLYYVKPLIVISELLLSTSFKAHFFTLSRCWLRYQQHFFPLIFKFQSFISTLCRILTRIICQSVIQAWQLFVRTSQEYLLELTRTSTTLSNFIILHIEIIYHWNLFKLFPQLIQGRPKLFFFESFILDSGSSCLTWLHLYLTRFSSKSCYSMNTSILSY